MTADIFRYFGGLGSELKGETMPARRACAVLHPPRAARRRRRHHPVERAGHAGRAQDRAGAVRRQHHGDEGGRGCAARRAADGRDLPGVPAARRAQRARPASARKCGGPLANHPGIRKLSFTGSTEVGKIDHARRGRAHRAGVARARRQEPVDRLSRRRRGLGGRRHHRRHALHAPEPELHGGLAPVPARGHLRFLPRASSRRRPRRSRSAIRSTRRPTSAPSSTTSSSPRSASTSTRA